MSTNGAWAVRAIQVALAILYFLSGYSKLRSIGIDWMWGDTLRQALQDKASSGETTALGFWVLDHAWILVLFQVISLLWELSFPLIFWRPMRYPIIIVGLLFNIGLWTTVKIEFFGVLACFAAFVPLDEWEQAARRRLTRHRDTIPLDVSYDPGCARCVGDITAVTVGDWSHRLRPVPGTHVTSEGLGGTPVPARLAVALTDRLPGTPPHATLAPSDRRTVDARRRPS